MERENSKWIIFGAGFAGKAAFSVLNGEVEFFIDNDKSKQNCKTEAPIIPLEEAKQRIHGKPVLLGTVDLKVELEMRDMLSDSGATQILSFSELSHISQYGEYDYSDILDAIWTDGTADEYIYHIRQWNDFTAKALVKPIDELCKKYQISGHKMIDIACGYGFWSLFFAQRHVDVLGIDNDANRLTVFRRTAKKYPHMTAVNADIRHIDMVPDCTYDVAFCANTIHVVPDWRKIISEMNRVTRKNGLIILVMNHPDNLYIKDQYKNIPVMQWDATQENIIEVIEPDSKLLEIVDISSDKGREFSQMPTHSILIFSKQ